MLMPPTAAWMRATGSSMSMPPKAIASSIERIGAAELLAPVRPGVERVGTTDGDVGLVGEGGEASGLVAPKPRERMLMPGTWSSLPTSDAPGANLVGLGERDIPLLNVVSGVLYCCCARAPAALEGVLSGLLVVLDKLVAGDRGDLGDVGLSETAFENPPLPVPRCSL